MYPYMAYKLSVWIAYMTTLKKYLFPITSLQLGYRRGGVKVKGQIPPPHPLVILSTGKVLKVIDLRHLRVSGNWGVYPIFIEGVVELLCTT